MAEEFLAENNPCGQVALHLVARGNAIIAELLRLKDYIPPVFRLDRKVDQQKYGEIISDFSYFKASDVYDKRIENSPVLQDLDEEFCENHIEILTRFYVALESIYKYATELNAYVEDLDEGVYIQQTLESVFATTDGRQIMCEAVYLYGVMLLVVDHHVSGEVRERLLVSYYRYSAQGSNIDAICQLLRSTAQAGSKRPVNYPEDYFKRTPLNDSLVTATLGWLRLDDVYNQIAAYPLPEQRSTALASQAAMLYVCLYFQPAVLHAHPSKMREIVDKYFPDNWVVSVYMGLTVNLVDSWEPFKAAKTALANTLEPANIKEHASAHAQKLQKFVALTKEMLKAGTLTKENVLDQMLRVVSTVRECNVTLRWLMLHTAVTHSLFENGKRSKQLRDQVIADSKHNELHVFHLLLNTAEFELKIKQLFKSLLSEREKAWDKCKVESQERMAELSEVFSGTKPLTRVEKNDQLQQWFADIGKQISTLQLDETVASGRKVAQLIQALDGVQEFHQLSTNVQVSQFLTDTRASLQRMVRAASIKDTVLITLQIVGDLSYAWHLIDTYTGYMQAGIKSDPALVSRLRATFLKLSSAMEVPLLRINQAASADLVSVSQYYSQELVAYVRRVLQIVPRTMFALMERTVALRTNAIRELPTRLDKDRLREFAQLDDRFEVAKLTYTVSVFTEGVLNMKSTLVGIVRIDPKQLLEDGIRKELVIHIATALHNGLTFSQKAKSTELGEKLEALGEIMDGHRRSFEYIQDYIGIYGLKIWQEELSRVIRFSVEMECNSFMRAKVAEWESAHQSRAIPIPSLPPPPHDATASVNFVGRLARQLIRITDPRTTMYVESANAWFDTKSQAKIVDLKFFSKISKAVGTSGATGLDRLFCFMIVTELQNTLGSLQKGVLKDKAWIDMFASVAKGLTPNSEPVANPGRYYIQSAGRAQKVWAQMSDCVLKIGQLQILRRHILYELRTSCRFQAKHLSTALNTMNQALLNEIRDHYRDPTAKAHPKEVLAEVSTYLDWAGIANPYAKIYVTTRNLQYFSLLTFLFTTVQLAKMHYVKSLGCLAWRKTGDALDVMPFIVGLQTLFRQFHSAVRSQFLLYMSQYVTSHIDASIRVGGKTELPPEVTNTLHFLESFACLSGLPRSAITEHIPEPIFDLFKNGISQKSTQS